MTLNPAIIVIVGLHPDHMSTEKFSRDDLIEKPANDKPSKQEKKRTTKSSSES